MTNAERKRREKQRKKAEAGRLRRLAVESKGIKSSISSEATENAYEKGTNKQTEHNPATNKQNKGFPWKAYRMSTFIGVLLSILLGVSILFFGIVVNNWDKPGYLWINFWWGIAGYLMLGCVVFSGYYYYVIKPAREAARHLQPAGIDRPELFFAGVDREPFVLGKPATFRSILKNGGKIAAHNITIGANIALVWSPFRGPLVFLPGVNKDTRLDLAPGEDLKTRVSDKDPMTQEWIEGLNAGRYLLFYFGQGEYEDETGRKYPIRFCYQYDPNNPSDMMICPNRYRPSEQSPESVLQNANRASIAIQNASLTTFGLNKKSKAVITLINSGGSTASIVRVYGHVEPRDQPLSPEMPGAKDVGKEPNPGIMPSGGITQITLSSGSVLTQDLLDLIGSGKGQIYVWGIVTYQDAFGKRWTKFCLIQDLKSMQLKSCTNNNETDQQNNPN
jgi:hypothetical protein